LNYSDDGVTKLNGQETVSATFPDLLDVDVLWASNLTQTGYNASSVSGGGTFFVVNKKTTSAGGFNLLINLGNPIFTATGSLTSLVNHVLYTQPGNGT
jgi:hypothetical protein